jgi:hypothetical protein
MSSIKLPHTSGNSMSIAAPATNPASDLTLTLPATIGTAGQILSVNGSGNLEWIDSPTFSSPIDVITTWKLDANQSAGDQIPISSHWVNENTEDQGLTPPAQSGGDVTQSSGVFTFPKTGIYLIIASFGTQLNGDSRWNSFYLETTTNNGGAWDQSAVTNQAISQGQSDNNYGWQAIQYVADIEDTSNHKVRFKFRCSNSSTLVTGGGDENFGSSTFVRIGAT